MVYKWREIIFTLLWYDFLAEEPVVMMGKDLRAAELKTDRINNREPGTSPQNEDINKFIISSQISPKEVPHNALARKQTGQGKPFVEEQ